MSGISPDEVIPYIVRLREIFNEKPEDHTLRDCDVGYLLGVTEAAANLWAVHEEYGGVLSAAEMAMQFQRVDAALRDDLGPEYGKA